MLIIYKGIFLKLWSKVLQIFLLFSLYFSSLNLKYLKLTKMDISRFAMKLFTCTDLFWASYDRGGVDCFIMQWKLDIKISDITNCFLRSQLNNLICYCLLTTDITKYITNKISRSQCSRYNRVSTVIFIRQDAT